MTNQVIVTLEMPVNEMLDLLGSMLHEKSHQLTEYTYEGQRRLYEVKELKAQTNGEVLGHYVDGTTFLTKLEEINKRLFDDRKLGGDERRDLANTMWVMLRHLNPIREGETLTTPEPKE